MIPLSRTQQCRTINSKLLVPPSGKFESIVLGQFFSPFLINAIMFSTTSFCIQITITYICLTDHLIVHMEVTEYCACENKTSGKVSVAVGILLIQL